MLLNQMAHLEDQAVRTGLIELNNLSIIQKKMMTTEMLLIICNL